MLPKTLWSHPELLREATAIFGLPCVLDAKTGGCATWTEGVLHHVQIEDRPERAATLTVRRAQQSQAQQSRAQGQAQGQSKTLLSYMPLITRQTPRLLSVQSDSAATALAGLTLAVAVNAGLFSAELALAKDLFAQWSRAAESKAGAKRLLRLLQYALAPGDKSWDDFERTLASR
jgi:hypothetical protein